MPAHHPESPHHLTELEVYEAVTSGYRRVEAIVPTGEVVRSLVPKTGLFQKLGEGDPKAPIFQIQRGGCAEPFLIQSTKAMNENRKMGFAILLLRIGAITRILIVNHLAGSSIKAGKKHQVEDALALFGPRS